VQSLRFFWISRHFGFPIGRFLVPAAPLISLAYVAIGSFSGHAESTLSVRPKLVEWLEHNGGSHLVLVRYGESHILGEEWVYNSADIDRSPVVWARDMGTQKNVELLSYYRQRKVWLLMPDSSVARLLPYGGAPDAGTR
jgi:hypothetical protein